MNEKGITARPSDNGGLAEVGDTVAAVVDEQHLARQRLGSFMRVGKVQGNGMRDARAERSGGHAPGEMSGRRRKEISPVERVAHRGEEVFGVQSTPR